MSVAVYAALASSRLTACGSCMCFRVLTLRRCIPCLCDPKFSNHNERFIALNSALVPGNAGAWCARSNDQSQWVEVDLGRPRLLLGVSTQGRSDYAQWVTEY